MVEMIRKGHSWRHHAHTRHDSPVTSLAYDNYLMSLHPVNRLRSSRSFHYRPNGKRSKLTSSIMNLIEFTWTLGCMSCLIAHCSLLIENYLKYPVTTETTVYVSRQVIPPAASMCFDIVKIRDM